MPPRCGNRIIILKGGVLKGSTLKDGILKGSTLKGDTLKCSTLKGGTLKVVLLKALHDSYPQSRLQD